MIKSRPHCHTYTPNLCPYQVSTSNALWFLRYGSDNSSKVKVTMARTKVKSRSHHHVAHLHPNQRLYQVSPYTLRFLRYSPDKIFKVMVTTARSKVKSRPHQDIAHLHPLINVLTKCQISTPYSPQEIAWTIFKGQGVSGKVKFPIKVTP